MTCESTLILLGWYRYAVAKSESNQGLRSYLNALCYLGGFELLLPPAVFYEGDCPKAVTESGFPSSGLVRGTGPCVVTLDFYDS